MLIIDTHCHTGLHKYEPVESLLSHMTRANVDHAVFIQYMGNTDNGYMVECMNAHPGRFAAAMLVEPNDDGSQIRAWAARGIVGIRLPANARTTGPDPLIHWRTADELGLVVSAPSNPQSLLSTEFAEVLAHFPDLSIVIEHLAGAKQTMTPPYPEFTQVLALAQHPNLTIKLPGFGEFCDLTNLFHANMLETQDVLEAALRDRSAALFDQIPPFADMTLEAFGPERMMWGSDYPPASTREGYDNALRVPLAWASTLSADEQAAIFGQTAQRVWQFS